MGIFVDEVRYGRRGLTKLVLKGVHSHFFVIKCSFLPYFFNKKYNLGVEIEFMFEGRVGEVDRRILILVDDGGVSQMRTIADQRGGGGIQKGLTLYFNDPFSFTKIFNEKLTSFLTLFKKIPQFSVKKKTRTCFSPML